MEKAFNEEINVEARIIGMSDSTLRVEVFSVDTKIPLRELGHRFITTEKMQEEFLIGDKVDVRITHLLVDEENDYIELEVSVRLANEDTLLDNIRQHNIGDTESGIVTQVTERGYFVSVGDYKTGVDIFCARVAELRLPERGDSVACEIQSIDYEAKRIYGKINRILKKKYRIE